MQRSASGASQTALLLPPRTSSSLDQEHRPHAALAQTVFFQPELLAADIDKGPLMRTIC